MSKTRKRAYLALFEKLEPGARNALRKIYTIARHGDPHGRHVILAMIASARHPAILKISLSNLMIRLGLKQAMMTGDAFWTAHYQAVLTDFHAALDEFMGETPREIVPGNDFGALHRLALNNPTLMEQVLRFKEKAGPAVKQAKLSSQMAR